LLRCDSFFQPHRSEPLRLDATWQAQQLADSANVNPQFMILLPEERGPLVLIHQHANNSHSKSAKSMRSTHEGATSHATRRSQVLWADWSELATHPHTAIEPTSVDTLEAARKFIAEHNLVLIGTSSDPTNDDPATQHQAHFAICSKTLFAHATNPQDVSQGFAQVLTKRASSHNTDDDKVVALSPRDAVFAPPDVPMADSDMSVIGVATSLLSWTSNLVALARSDPDHPVVSTSGGWAMDLTGLGSTNYPRIDPVVMGVIVDTATDSLLLTRKASSHKKRFTLVAGFMEVGESIEQSVAREIKEEVGIR
jgi:NADH pyrophosphatase NudC (nudix superfamily)